MFMNPGSRADRGGDGREKFTLGVNVGSNVFINTSVLFLGNGASNIVSNSIGIQVTNNIAQTMIQPGTLTLSGAGSNAGLTIGTSSITANGYSFFPNGLLFQWGRVNVTSTANHVNFPTTFPTTCFSVTIAGNTMVNATAATNEKTAYVINANTTGFVSQSNSATASAIFWMAIGN